MKHNLHLTYYPTPPEGEQVVRRSRLLKVQTTPGILRGRTRAARAIPREGGLCKTVYLSNVALRVSIEIADQRK